MSVQAVSNSDLDRLGALLTATGPAMELRSPLTGQPMGELPTSTAADVEVGAQLARRAQATWAARPIEERAQLLLNFHDQLRMRTSVTESVSLALSRMTLAVASWTSTERTEPITVAERDRIDRELALDEEVLYGAARS